MKVKITEYRGCIVVETLNPNEKSEDWVPNGPGRIGCILIDTAKNLGVSEEALAALASIEKNRDDIGDVDWIACADGKKAFAWIGPPTKVIPAVAARGSAQHAVFRNDCTIIPNDASEEIKKFVDKCYDD